jgi:hypothetical protein
VRQHRGTESGCLTWQTVQLVVHENEHSHLCRHCRRRVVSRVWVQKTLRNEEGQSRALQHGKTLRSALEPSSGGAAARNHRETNQKVHNEHRAPRAMPQGTESAQMRTQKLRLTFSTDAHIHIT